MMCFGTCGAAAHLAPAGEFFRVVRSYGRFGGNWVLPKGHVKAVVDPLVRLIKSKGSEIQTRTTVEKVVIKDMEVKGLVAESQGKKIEVEAQAVISDCSPHQMIELVGEENLEKGYLEKARSLKAPEGCSIFWECDKPMFDSPSVINFPFFDNPFHGFFAMDLSQTWPDICPKGKYTLWAGFWFPPDYDVRTEIERSIRQCKENFPGLEKHGEILLVQVFRKTWAMTWAINGYDLSQKTPIERLYVVGDGAKPPGYAMAEGVVEGSRLAVEDIKGRIKPEI
jgi:phytoene dehydrogenase-like protein